MSDVDTKLTSALRRIRDIAVRYAERTFESRGFDSADLSSFDSDNAALDQSCEMDWSSESDSESDSARRGDAIGMSRFMSYLLID